MVPTHSCSTISPSRKQGLDKTIMSTMSIAETIEAGILLHVLAAAQEAPTAQLAMNILVDAPPVAEATTVSYLVEFPHGLP